MASSEPLIRPPLQRRSQESLQRVLEAGLGVLRDEGFDGFTLLEVSRRSGVSIGSIYARVSGREGLIMAIYDRAMAGTDSHIDVTRAGDRGELTPRERIEALVTTVANGMLVHADVLRVFMRQAPLNPEILRRAAAKTHETSGEFERAVLAHRGDLRHSEPELAVDIAFRMVQSVISRRITHGPRFESARVISDQTLVRELARAVADYLL